MEKLWTTSEVAAFLGINEIDVEQLVQQGKLTGYKLGGRFLRFRPDQVKSLKATMRFRRSTTVAAVPAASWPQRARDFFYFYDFYLVSAGLLAILIVYLVATG
jgi:excisionase family DNA binding protein